MAYSFHCGWYFGLVALYLRTYLKETPVFKAMQARKEISKEMPVKQVLKRIKQPLQLACYLHGF